MSPGFEPKMSEVSIIICALNEARNLHRVLPGLPRDAREVILVDGCSEDGTADIAARLLPSVRIVRREPRGRGDALTCAIRAATGRYVLFIDADGSQRPEEIPAMVAKAAEGYDVVKGSRFLPGARSEDYTPLRRFLTRILQRVTNCLWRTHDTDTGYGFRLIDRARFLRLGVQAKGFDFEWELAAKEKRHGLRVIEVPSIELRREHGKSRLGLIRDGTIITLRIFREFINGFSRPADD
jgi:glycosyltransferase involved in cell wall biosynthesis